MSGFTHQRHQPPTPLDRPRELILAVPPLRSNVNLARIVRTAGCCGISRVVACGGRRVEPKIARDALKSVQIQRPRSLEPVLRYWQRQGYRLVGLEQADGSKNLHDFRFPRRLVLVVGHEREGMDDAILRLLDDVVEIPVYGLPYSYNVAVATAMALYEYCRQFPSG
jgi:tRNA G18 (ribose-2'-O)-methylase SpoU